MQICVDPLCKRRRKTVELPTLSATAFLDLMATALRCRYGAVVLVESAEEVCDWRSIIFIVMSYVQ
jgi:hypothetical protein